MAQSVAERFAVVKEIYRREIEQQPVATNVEQLPVSYELISDEWLTQALCAKVPGARVVSHILDMPDEGTSNRRRIFLTYNDVGTRAALPASVFCKATQSLESRFVLGLNRSIEGETIFYNRIRPLLDIEAPVGLFANVNVESLNSILIMKDMSGQVEFCDHRTPISRQQAERQVELLAKVHGAFYGKPERQKLLDPYLTLSAWADLTQEAINWSDARIRGFRAGEQVIPARLFRHAEEVDPLTQRAFASHAQLPVTLVHSDVHLKNWYITRDRRMGLGDWQICVKACGIRDLAYAISTSLAIDDRRAWEMDLIRRYLDCIAAEDAPHVGFDETLRLYRQQLLCALAMWTATLTPAPGSPEMQPPETSLEFIKRMAHAIDDLDALDSF